MNTIYIGKSGLFKREKALAMARAILNPKCLDTHPDFLFVEPDKGKISVVEATKIAEFISFAAMEAEEKVVVIDKCHLATVEFQQAILKLLEDGGKKASFILTTEEPLLPTIHSRCRVIAEREWSHSRMEEWIKAENLPYDAVVLALASGRPGLYRELLRDEEFRNKVELFQENLVNRPHEAVIQLGALEENYYEAGDREKENLLISFIERFLSQHLLDTMVLSVEQMLSAIDICSDERNNIRNRAYGKTESFRFYRTLHSVLCGG